MLIRIRSSCLDGIGRTDNSCSPSPNTCSQQQRTYTGITPQPFHLSTSSTPYVISSYILSQVSRVELHLVSKIFEVSGTEKSQQELIWRRKTIAFLRKAGKLVLKKAKKPKVRRKVKKEGEGRHKTASSESEGYEDLESEVSEVSEISDLDAKLVITGKEYDEEAEDSEEGRRRRKREREERRRRAVDERMAKERKSEGEDEGVEGGMVFTTEGERQESEGVWIESESDSDSSVGNEGGPQGKWTDNEPDEDESEAQSVVIEGGRESEGGEEREGDLFDDSFLAFLQASSQGPEV